jgi:glucosylglycerate synthase
VPAFGFEYSVGLEQINVNTARMINTFREGLRNLGEIWLEILGGGDFKEVERLGKLADDQFHFPIALWTRVVYDYALAFHRKKFPVEQLIKSMTPLYVGKTASFILEAKDMMQQDAEAEIEKLCVEFENSKDYLVSNWN